MKGKDYLHTLNEWNIEQALKKSKEGIVKLQLYFFSKFGLAYFSPSFRAKIVLTRKAVWENIFNQFIIMAVSLWYFWKIVKCFVCIWI